MPGPIQSGISSVIGTAQVGGIVKKHFKEQEVSAKAQAEQAEKQTGLIEKGEEARTAAVKKTEDEKLRLAEEARKEELAKSRQSELAKLAREEKLKGPQEYEKKRDVNLALDRAGMNMSYEDYESLKKYLREKSPVELLYAQLSDPKIHNFVRSDMYRTQLSKEQYLYAQSQIRQTAEDKYYKKAIERVKTFQESESYKLRMMYAKGEIGSRQELTQKLVRLNEDFDYNLRPEDFEPKNHGGEK